MTREEIAAIAAENNVELPKGFISQILTAFNSEKKNAVVEAANKALDDFKDWKSPEEYAELENKINEMTESTAKQGRVAKYKEAGLNVDDEDILTLIDGKLKDEKDLAKAITEYAKAHPSFVKQVTNPNPTPQPKAPEPQKFEFGGSGSGNPVPQPKSSKEILREHYAQQGNK